MCNMCIICNLKYSIPKEIPVVFHNGSNYDSHFIIKELAKDFEEKFNCLGENTGKCKTFPFSITKEIVNTEKKLQKLYQITIY